jgi:subfamily B ATP-binding cassette protein HlyB/CyaB
MLLQAANALGFKTGLRTLSGGRIHRLALPCLALLKSAQPATSQSSQSVEPESSTPENYSLALIIKADGERVLFFEASSQTPTVLPIAKFAMRFTGQAILFAIRAKPIGDRDLPDSSRQEFGFRWFIPELLKYKAIWRDVLLASLTIQLMALATPLFTQVVIDKVVVHHTLSTLTVIGVALAVFMIFTAAMTWIRHYLVLHTGNRVDAVLYNSRVSLIKDCHSSDEIRSPNDRRRA